MKFNLEHYDSATQQELTDVMTWLMGVGKQVLMQQHYFKITGAFDNEFVFDVVQK